MRKKKKDPRLLPYAVGIAAGYGALLLISGIAALIVLITDVTALAGASAIFAIAAGSFINGRIVGKIKRKSGLKTGALCGAVFIVPIILLSVIFGKAGSFMLFVKIILSVIFGAAGGVSGVNAKET